MPVENQDNKVLLNGNGSIKDFSFSFKIFKEENLSVKIISADGTETTKSLGVDYSVASDDFNMGGTVTFNTAPLATEKVLIIRSIPLIQDANFRPVSGFPEEVITDSFDAGIMIDQDLQEQINRCLKAPSYVSSDYTLPLAEAGKALMWDKEAKKIVNSDDIFNNIVSDATAQAQIATEKAAEASASASAVALAASSAETSKNLAQDWAVKMDGKVEDIDYSARYYAELAAIRVGSSMLPLFYRIASDHVLSGVEAKGKLLQGSLVTNLYPDAVAHIKADWDNGTVQTFTLDNINFEYKVAQDKHLIVDIANKTQVDELFELTGIAEFYILDYVNNQFYLPRNLWFDQYTNDPEKVNKYNEPQIPNITGSISNVLMNVNATGSGCHRVVKNGNAVQGSSAYGQIHTMYTDLSRVNSIYKDDCNTVQPPLSNKLLYFVVGNTYVNQEDIDIAQVESELNNKVNINADNFSAIGKETIISLGMPDYSAAVTISSLPYTAPTDGYIIGYIVTGGTGSAGAFINDLPIGRESGDYIDVQVLVSKGDVLTSDASQNTVKFCPLKGISQYD